MHQRAGQDQAPLHPAGERPGALVALVAERERLDQLGGALAALATRHPEVARVVVEGLGNGEKPVEVELLRRQPDCLARLAVVVDRVVAEDLDRSRGRLREPGRAVDQGRLAGAVGAQQPEELPRLDLERDAAQRLDPGRVALDQALDLQGVRFDRGVEAVDGGVVVQGDQGRDRPQGRTSSEVEVKACWQRLTTTARSAAGSRCRLPARSPAVRARCRLREAGSAPPSPRTRPHDCPRS